METLICRHCHHLPADEIETLLETRFQQGLSVAEVKRRQEHFGPNILSSKKPMNPLLRLLFQFHQPLVYILLFAGVITALLGEWVDSSVIMGVVIINALIGFVQESKAESAIESLKKMVITEATVLRGGKKTRISSLEVVPGDIVFLQSGDKVPADLRLLSVKDLAVDESALTGESVSVEKTSFLLEKDTILADRKNMAYAGTLVTYGQGHGVVAATGDKTATGQISQLLSKTVELSTPLTIKITKFSKLLLYVILGLAAVTFLVGLIRGEPAFEMFMAAVALAVGAIPEGLPAAITIMLAIGVKRMARFNALIRKLPAVETLGSTTVICSDKTGTLTKNEMTVQEIIAGGDSYNVGGTGYEPVGKIVVEDSSSIATTAEALHECLIAGLLCNDSQLVLLEDGRWKVEGDPTEGALIAAVMKSTIDEEATKVRLPRVDILPFESHHQYMATLHSGGDQQRLTIYAKGAVEKIVERCNTQLDNQGNEAPIDTDAILNHADKMAAKGLRVLAFARGSMPHEKEQLSHDNLTGGLTFLGLQGMIDPPRPEAIEAIRKCSTAGIEVRMITGDHAITASAIAQKLGLVDTNDGQDHPRLAMTGKELAALSDQEIVQAASSIKVFARVAPEQKLRIVDALQEPGNVVAMTGDGVNDAPALKQANIGVAMGITGTEVAKEAADMILTDDNFASIVTAVQEGRRVFDNLTKFILWTLPTNMGEGLVILAAVLSGAMLPILPVQILWINMTTALFLGLMLAFEPEEKDIMNRPPRDPAGPILSGELIGRIILVSFILLVSAFGLFMWHNSRTGNIEEARTMAVNVFVMGELFYLFNCRSLTKSMFDIGLFSNPSVLFGSLTMIILQLTFTYLPVMNKIFQSSPINFQSWAAICLVSFCIYVAVGTEKWIRRRFSQRKPKPTIK